MEIIDPSIIAMKAIFQKSQTGAQNLLQTKMAHLSKLDNTYQVLPVVDADSRHYSLETVYH